MVLRRKRWWLPLLLSLSLSTLFQGCSSTEEEEGEEGLEVSGEADNLAEEEMAENGEDDGSEEEENYAEDGSEEGNANANSEEYESEEEEGSNEYAEGAENNYGNDLENLVNGNVETTNNTGEEMATEGNEVLIPNGNDSSMTNGQASANATVNQSANASVNPAPANVGPNGYEDLSSTPSAGAGANAAPFTPAAGVLLPEMGSKMPYIMKSRESLSSVAQMIYGSSDKWQDMASLSAVDNPSRIRTGDVVYYQLNEQTMAFAQAYENTPRQVHVVRPGDSLSKIAQEYYGSSEDWASIWRQNGDISNPDRIEVGQSIYFLSTQALAKAIDYAKTTQLADLIQSNNNSDSLKTTKVSAEKSPANQVSSQATSTLSGFQIALDLVNHLGS